MGMSDRKIHAKYPIKPLPTLVIFTFVGTKHEARCVRLSNGHIVRRATTRDGGADRMP